MLARLSVAAVAVVALTTASARAEDDPALAVLVGGAAIVVGMGVGGTLLAATGSDPTGNQAGWLVMETSFAVAPFAAHGVMGEWGRGALFASAPTLAVAGTVPVFLEDPNAIGTGTLWEQRLIWGFFCGGLATGIAGVVDATLAPGRQIHVAPMASSSGAGVVVGGTL